MNIHEIFRSGKRWDKNSELDFGVSLYLDISKITSITGGCKKKIVVLQLYARCQHYRSWRRFELPEYFLA